MAIGPFTPHDNLMLFGGIVSSGGCMIDEAVPHAERYMSLVAFERCAARAAADLAPGTPRRFGVVMTQAPALVVHWLLHSSTFVASSAAHHPFDGHRRESDRSRYSSRPVARRKLA
jgi:hypothetical protein